MKTFFTTIIAIAMLFACNISDDINKQRTDKKIEIGYDKRILDLIKEKKAFEKGSYAKGEIPKGLYAFISKTGGYYSEEVNGQILDNENFNSFGYIFNQGLGDITTGGLLIKIENFSETGFDSPKLYYESLTGQKDYNFSGMYKVGLDIPAGKYLLESVGEGYMEVSTGAIGNSEIIENDNFNGKKTVSLKSGEYLKLSKVKIITK